MAVISPGGYSYPPRTPEELRKEKIFRNRILVGIAAITTITVAGTVYYFEPPKYEPPPKIEYFEDVTESGGRVKPVIRTNRGGEYFFNGQCFQSDYGGKAIITCQYIPKSDLEKSVHE